jgi:type IV pilus assembly protein PilA
MRKEITKNQKGFSLLELLIVVAVILVIAAIAIPNLIKAKTAANQSTAPSALRSIATAEEVYKASAAVSQYDTMAALATNGQMDTALVTAMTSATGHDGYKFSEVAAPTADTFAFVALPVNYPTSGKNGYCVDQTKVIHVIDGAAGAPAAPADAAACLALPILGK